MSSKIEKTDAEWREMLSEEQFEVTRKHATERAFSGKYWDSHGSGIYRCVCCDAALFNSEKKYDSGSGWPSFYKTVDNDKVGLKKEWDGRIECSCKTCNCHLGHVFGDGPKKSDYPAEEKVPESNFNVGPYRLPRYCINGASLRFNPMETGAGDDTK